MRKLAWLIASGALAVAVLGSTAPSAQAEACFNKFHPSDPSWISICNRDRIAVCDNQADGHYTWARYIYQRSSVWLSTKEDSYGRDSKGQFCWHERAGFGFGVALVKVCVSYEGCGPPRDAGGPSRVFRADIRALRAVPGPSLAGL